MQIVKRQFFFDKKTPTFDQTTRWLWGQILLQYSIFLVKASGWQYSSQGIYFLSRLFKCSTALSNKGSLSLAAFPLKLICCAPTLAEIPLPWRCICAAETSETLLNGGGEDVIVAMPICPASSYPLPSCCHSKGHAAQLVMLSRLRRSQQQQGGLVERICLTVADAQSPD